MIVDKKWSLLTPSSRPREVCQRGHWEGHRSLQRASYIAFVLMLVARAIALAQTGPPFTEPPRLCPIGNPGSRVLNVTLQIQSVPYTRADGTQMQVRAYHLAQGSGWQYCDGQQHPIQNPQIPGPTFQLRKGTQGKTDGDKFQMTLVNQLPVGGSNHECNPVRDFSVNSVTIQPNQACNADAFPLLQGLKMPACFHGDNVTNFHYHGFHVSPQPHQDFVLLNLYPTGTQHIPPGDINAVGSYNYALDPLPYTQAEGTHWYHPHKHGSTALQVLNGMAGTFIITGPFDDWLNGQFNGNLADKVIVVQQIAQENNFYGLTGATFTNQCPSGSQTCTCTVNIGAPFADPTGVPTLVNGKINPVITMRSGEIQRWRLVNSMVQIGGLLQVGFSPEFQVRQIAQDGVQFSPENYTSQPLLSTAWFVPGQAPQVLTNASLAPGNRVDYLVKAPILAPGQPQTCYQNVQTVVGNVNVGVRRRLVARAQAPSQLLTVCVTPSSTPPMEFPTTWPSLPPFLANIPPQSTQTTVAFSMTGPDGQVTQPTDPHNNFFINNVQYCPNCANQTMTLGTAYEWILTNDSTPQHPFHIHINPHQLVERGSIINGQPVPFQQYSSPVWEDTIALPAVTQASNKQGCWNLPAGPIADNTAAQQQCPTVCQQRSTTWNGEWVTTVPGQRSVCQCCPLDGTPGYTRIRQQPIDFTGEFVLHCHILGHEDRGMMQNVQVVCPPPNQTSFGKPKPGQSECVDGNYISAAPQCPESYKTSDNCPLIQ
jgi:FtsP/CotA-like multicopper oxidase with cupredoxin domain